MNRLMLLSLAVLAALTMSMLATASPVAAQVYQHHAVQPGETLAKIARLYCTSWQDVYRLNRDTVGPNPSAVEPGMILTVQSRCGAVHLPSPPTSSVHDRGPRTHAAGTFRSPYYTTTWGDTLFSIGQRFGVTAAQLRQANGMSGNYIRAGMALLIPGATGSESVPVPPGGAPIPESERVFFGHGNISATRVAILNRGTPKRYILGGQAGRVMEIGTISHGEPVIVTVTTVNGQQLTLNGENGKLRNNLYVRLPSTADYVVTMAPAVPTENPQVAVDVTFIIQ